MVLNKNEFGGLVKAYRKQRGWTQEDLAERWGHTRGYVSQVEAGQRKLDSAVQVIRLAEILDIPQEKLEAIGRGIPTRQPKTQAPAQVDAEMLQMLLAPGRDMVRLSYMVWLADQHPVVEANLRNLAFNLGQLVTVYRGEFRTPARQLLASTHQMLGKIAFDRLDYAAAGGHFSEMLDLGQELNDADIITTGMIHQGSILRKRGRYEQAIRCFEATKPFADVASQSIRGVRCNLLARVYYDFGEEQSFLRTIDQALGIAADMRESIDSLANEFSLDDVLQEQASGFTELGKPEKALEIYREADRLRPFRPLREQGSYTITKAQAYLRLGDFDQGIRLSLRGIQKASVYRSKRQILWLEKTYNQLRLLPHGRDSRLNTLREALAESKREQELW